MMKRDRTGGGIPSLEAALSDYMNASELKKLVSLTGSRGLTRKDDLIALVMHHLDGDGLRSVWRSLDELQQAAVAEVVHSRGTSFAAERFRAKYGRDPSWGALTADRRIARPTALHFFFYANGVMPDDLKERLRAFVPPPAPAIVKTLDQLPAAHDRPYERWNAAQKASEKRTERVALIVCESERAAQRELVSILRLVDARKIAVSDKTRRASAGTVDAITAILEEGDYYPVERPKNKWYDENAGPIRAFAWPLLVQAGGLAQISGSSLQLTKLGRKSLSAPVPEVIRVLWDRWLSTTIFDELSRIECIKGQTGKGKRGLTAVGGRRGEIAEVLADCPEMRWIGVEDFLTFLRASERDFSVTRNPWDLYIGELQYGSLGYDGGERILEERYILCFLLEYAATLGLIDVAYIRPAGARPDYRNMWGTDDFPYFSRYDGLMYLRINALGAYCLGRTSTYAPPPVEQKPAIRVFPNLEIVASGEGIEQADRLALDAYAVRVSDLVWQLRAGRLLSAVEEGRSIPEIREFLAARSDAALPDTVVRLLEEVSERSGQVRDRGLARLIECDDPALAARIAGDARTRKHCTRAGERHLVVLSSSEAAFRRALRDLGYLLAASEAGVGKARPEALVKRRSRMTTTSQR
jgi:hypothetical protein